jgi:hypothetical protein
MQAGVNALQAALDAAASPVYFFLRDDDAGWDDARLFSLLDCTEHAGVPIDLAVIPQICSDALAHALCARIDASPGEIGVHQHGYAHANHETAGRKCEFGGARSIDDQRRDLCRGRERLRELFGARLDGLFTPPWNRCSPATPALLAELGYSALSRDRTAPVQSALPEWAVDVDWCKQRRLAAQQGEDGFDRIGFELARQIGAGHPIGLMLHHAEMDACDLLLLDALLAASAPHPRACWVSMAGLSRVCTP